MIIVLLSGGSETTGPAFGLVNAHFSVDNIEG